jgi:hypothetical protein
VEVRVDATGHAEIVEINPRVGGGLLWDSVRLQYDRSLLDDWIDVLSGTPVTPLIPRRCGTYMQLAYPVARKQIVDLDHNTQLPKPEVYDESVGPGSVALANRESFGADALWATGLTTHRDEVAALVADEYCTFVYAAGMTGAPVMLVLEPDAALWRAVAEAPEGVDVVVCHEDAVEPTPEYRAARERIAQLVAVASWADEHAAAATVLQACGAAPIGDILAAQRISRDVPDLIKAGVPA